ncbi:excinuclease ABC subunit UvrC [Aequoribacter sp.]|uniref:excinuclease ABC subunit UvrC n=1 Tax=Aequoribacter sp. TaxID=2847771 RepID=UPI003F69E25B
MFDSEAFLKQLTQRPGVYQMLGSEGEILYVGKAKNLKARVSSYFRASGLTTKTMALVAKIADIQVTVTSTEVDALLLEHNLIKEHKPPYNILLKDDKSYPYIFLSTQDTYPRLAFHRGSKRKKGQYFGPYPSSGAVRESLHFLQKTFRVRQCEDAYFRNRSRPCLQHQIGRCTGPCVPGFVTEEEYAEQVESTRLFLQGKSQELMAKLADDMEACAERLEFEKAAVLRDQLGHIQQVQSSQGIEGVRGDLDIIACATRHGKACVHVLFVREGRVIGSRSYYPGLAIDDTEASTLSAFVLQYYLANERPVPQEVIVSNELDEVQALNELLTQRAKVKVSVKHRVREARARWLQLAVQTADTNLMAHLEAKETTRARLVALQKAAQLGSLPERIECFDISHSSGAQTVASCVVFGVDGAKKSDYRKFNIEGITGGDDYAAMQQALERRFKRLKNGEGVKPDVLLIDGGKGQVSQAMSVLEALQIDDIVVIGVAKGTTRKAGFETLINGATGKEWQLQSDDPALHLIQYIRDESHRFAITGHRARRAKQHQSALESIPGVGAKRRRDLLRHFGSAQGVKGANIEELIKVPGINRALAEQIVEHLQAGRE